MIIQPQFVMPRQAAGGSGAIVYPDFCFNRDVTSDPSIIDSVSGFDTGVDWGTAEASGPATVHGIVGWRVAYASQRAFDIPLESGFNLYAIGFEILDAPTTSNELSTTTTYGGVVEFDGDVKNKVVLGSYLGSISNELITLQNIVVQPKIASYTSAAAISLADEKLDVLFVWNGSSYDLYLNGTQVSVSYGGYEPITSVMTVSNFTYGQNSTNDIVFGAVAFWGSQLSSEEAAAIASNFRVAIV